MPEASPPAWNLPDPEEGESPDLTQVQFGDPALDRLFHVPALTATVDAQDEVFRGYFGVTRLTLRHDRFAGGASPAFQREIFRRGQAAAVLLYDPRLDRLVLVEQFRPAILLAAQGAAAHFQPWLIECVAGVLDHDGEDVEAVARRETVEEAGLTLGRLELIQRYAVSPGSSDEIVHLYVGEVDASQAGGLHGLAEENEDIRVHVVEPRAAMALLQTPRVANATTLIALSWFALNRDLLRQRWLDRP